jgi:hypothetical protein
VGTPNGIGAFQPTGQARGGEKGSVSGNSGNSGGATAGLPIAHPGAPPTTTSSSAGSTAKPTIQLSRLALTLNAIVALNRVRPQVSRVAFAFTISAGARVRVTLAKRVRVRGHARWKLLRDSLTIAAARGRNRRHLAGHNTLAPGRYRLTLTPAHGAPRSIVFQIG